MKDWLGSTVAVMDSKTSDHKMHFVRAYEVQRVKAQGDRLAGRCRDGQPMKRAIASADIGEAHGMIEQPRLT